MRRVLFHKSISVFKKRNPAAAGKRGSLLLLCDKLVINQADTKRFPPDTGQYHSDAEDKAATQLIFEATLRFLAGRFQSLGCFTASVDA